MTVRSFENTDIHFAIFPHKYYNVAVCKELLLTNKIYIAKYLNTKLMMCH